MAVALVVLAIFGVVILPSSSAVRVSGRTATTTPFGIPRPQPTDVPGYLPQDKGLLIKTPTAGISKAKVQFTMPDIYVRGFGTLCFATGDSDGVTNFGAGPLCNSLLGIPLPSAYQNPTHNIAGAVLDTYVVSSPGPNATYGSFPPVEVNALVFGSIPVSATVHLDQTISGPYIDPLRAQYAYIDAPEDTGELAYPGFPRVPERSPDGFESLYYKSSIDGTVNVRLDNVKVDGVSVGTDASCSTIAPAVIKVRNALGYTYIAATGIRGTRGTPSGFEPSNAGGYFDGSVDIPAFHDCRSGRDDYSALLTALVSGPNNTISGLLDVGLLQPSTDWCNTPVAHCAQQQLRELRKFLTLERKYARSSNPTVRRQLQLSMASLTLPRPKVRRG